MLTNAQMTEGRYLRFYRARRKIAWIKAHLEAGGTVYICTYTRITKLTKKHIDMVKATKSGVYCQHGRKWLNFDYCKLEAH